MITLPLTYSQFDLRWCNKILGNNTDQKYDFYNDACLISVLASILVYYGISTDPAKLNDALVIQNGFPAGSGEYIWGSLPRLFPEITEIRTVTPGILTDQQMGEIKSALDTGFPVLVQIDYNPKTSNLESHFVCLLGYDNNDENNFTIYDPLGGKIHSLKDYLGWFQPSVRTDILQYSIYKGTVPLVMSDDTFILKKEVFPPLVHGSTQWDQTIGKYMPTQDPKQTDFSALQAVIGGIQSSATAANNANSKTTQDLAVATQEIENYKEKLALQEQQQQANAETYKAQIIALQPNSQATTILIGKYTDQITALQEQIKGLVDEKHVISNELAKSQAIIPVKQTPSLFERLFPTFISFLQKKIK